MKNKPGEKLILSLVDMLAVHTVESDIINRALALICDTFSFGCGFVYEIDQYNFFILKERHISNDVKLRESFSVDEWKPAQRQQFSGQTFVFANREHKQDAYIAELLNFFFASSLAAIPIVDEKQRLCGIVGLLDSDTRKLSKPDARLLITALHMLGRYIKIRVYQSKVNFARLSLESIMDNTGIDIYVNDFYNHDMLYVNQSMAAPYGGAEHFAGKKCWEALYDDKDGQCDFCPQKKLIDEHGHPTKVYSWDYQRPFDGAWFRVFSAAFRWIDGRLAHVVSSVDITENKQNESLIRHMANYDALTQLPNRRKLISDCEERIAQADKGEIGYVLFMDLDGFKQINDQYGHDAGDEFLVTLGDFLRSIPEIEQTAYRNGGDEFVILMDHVSEQDVRDVIHTILTRFKGSWQLAEGEVSCDASIGIARYPEDGETAEDLLHAADQAMYHVKNRGGGNACFVYEQKNS